MSNRGKRIRWTEGEGLWEPSGKMKAALAETDILQIFREGIEI